MLSCKKCWPSKLHVCHAICLNRMNCLLGTIELLSESMFADLTMILRNPNGGKAVIMFQFKNWASCVTSKVIQQEICKVKPMVTALGANDQHLLVVASTNTSRTVVIGEPEALEGVNVLVLNQEQLRQLFGQRQLDYLHGVRKASSPKRKGTS